MNDPSKAIFDSLKTGPLLVSDLPEASIFDRELIAQVLVDSPLNFEQKLGHLYEDALESLIIGSEKMSLIGSHLQVFDSTGRTLGEFDFIVLDHTSGQHLHLELAVKFYLAVKSEDGWIFPGPDPRDNWPRKLRRMRTHQFRLSERPEAKALLETSYGIESIEAQQLIYGCLFQPVDSDENPRLESMASDARRGRWLYASQWSQHFQDVGEVRLIPKALWPVELTAGLVEILDLIPVTELLAQAAERCVCFVPEGLFEPWFLVPDEWPRTTTGPPQLFRAIPLG